MTTSSDILFIKIKQLSKLVVIQSAINKINYTTTKQ